MRVMPAIDLREGAAVQLVGGSYEEERVRLPDPLTVASEWFDNGFDALHVVDLDAATDHGDNTALMAEMTSRWPGRIQVGGGIRTTTKAAELIEAGASRVVVGTRGLEDADWLAQLAERFDSRVVLALDVRDNAVVTRGWKQAHHETADEVLSRVKSIELGAILVTAVHAEGLLEGPDLGALQAIRGATEHRLIAAGGIRNPNDVDQLAALGIEEAVVGMAMYTGSPADKGSSQWQP